MELKTSRETIVYGKIFASTFTGSMVGSGADVFAVWSYIIANTGPDSVVELNPVLIAAQIGISKEAVSVVLDFLGSPDPNSRTKTEDGKRIEKIGEFSYHVVNHAHYRGLRNNEDRREQNRAAQRRFQDRKSRIIQDISRDKPNKAHAESESESESQEDKSKNWGLTPPVEQELDGSPVKRVFDHWRTEHKHPRAALDPKRRRVIQSALKLYDEQTLCQSISGYLNSPHHMGENDSRTVYDDIALLLRDAQRIEAGLRFAIQGHASPKMSEVAKAQAKLHREIHEHQRVVAEQTGTSESCLVQTNGVLR